MALALVERRSAIDTELLDWAAQRLLSVHRNPKGWEIWLKGPDRQPLTDHEELYRAQSLREALAMAREAHRDGL